MEIAPWWGVASVAELRLRTHPRSFDSGTIGWSGEAFEHETDHGEANECGGSARVAFKLSRQPSIAAYPCERPLNDPALRQDHEAMRVRTLDDFDLPASCRANRSGSL